tara:strand:+ start:15008 stop:15169 length:162 start_codon:yes stop_codon:yes gene_type:complete
VESTKTSTHIETKTATGTEATATHTGAAMALDPLEMSAMVIGVTGAGVAAWAL